jgi:acetoin utilization protein AcuB
MKLGDIMTPHVVTVSPDDTLGTIRNIFNRYKFHHVIVVEHGKAIGVISDRDLLKNVSPFLGKLEERARDAASLSKKAHQIMSRGLVSAPESMPVPEAILMMIGSNISCIPVLNEYSRPIGIVTSHDLLRWCTRCVNAAA